MARHRFLTCHRSGVDPPGFFRCQLPALFPRRRHGRCRRRHLHRDGRAAAAGRRASVHPCRRSVRRHRRVGAAYPGARRSERLSAAVGFGLHHLFAPAQQRQRKKKLFPEWYIGKHLGVTLTDAQTAELNQVFDAILANNLAQPQVFVHRDYHSRNLMVRDAGNPGILDFQDAVYGPITYDLVSLLRDAYIQWDEEMVLDWAIRYWERARKAGLPVTPDVDAFYRDFEIMGLQRFLFVFGIFARLYL